MHEAANDVNYRTCNEFIRWFHHSRIPNLRMLLKMDICYDFFFNWQTEAKKTVLDHNQ